MLISNEMLGKFYCSSKLKINHRRLIKDSYINNKPNLAWCNKKCGMVVKRSNCNTVTCSCGSTFCFLCRSDAHHPATCRQIRDWGKQHLNTNYSDGMTLSWISLNTRECPRCFIPILKNGGCNHMTCTGCRYDYCWVCFGNWWTHFGGCKQKDIQVAQSRLNFRATSNISAQRLFLYENHKKCLEREQQVATKFKFRSTLAECRRTLMNSYVFGYYLKNGMYTKTLEKHQQTLEIAVGKLASQSNVYFPDDIETLESGRRALKLAEECLALRRSLLVHCSKGGEHENLEGRQSVEQQRKEPLQTTRNTVGNASTAASPFTVSFIEILAWACLFSLVLCTQPSLQVQKMTTFNDSGTTSNQVLSSQNIFDEISSAVSKLEPIIPITPEQRQLLLLKFNWDIESLRNSIQEYADTNSFLIENGVSPKNTVSFIKKSECEVCCSELMVLGLRCRHMACLNCWSKYLTAQIKNKQCMLSCFGCGMLISNEILGHFLSSSKLKITHRKLIKYSYINSDPSLAWCNRKCGMAVRRLYNNDVTCSCGSTFCISCKSDAHYPATCRQLRFWEEQCSNSDGITLSWIIFNTRECPRCFIRIQKNGGCYHMTCTGCHYEFCWVCSQNWKTHIDGCKQSDVTMEQFRLKPRDNSSVFAQHVARFNHHKRCLEREQQVATKFKFRNTLAECRRTLMNSYVFGYYLKDGLYARTLEEHQQNLEIVVEKLASRWNVYFKSGRKILKLAKECLTLRKTLMAHCASGAEHEDIEGRQPKMTTFNDSGTTSNQVLSSQNIFDEISSAVSKLEPILPITPEQRQLLFLKFNWDIESLKNSIQEYADTNTFLIENDVCPENTVSVLKKSECEICCSKLMVLGLRCRHMACLNCWSKYLTAKIKNKQCMLSCFGCGMLISNEILGNFLSSHKLKIAHRKLIKYSYMNSDSSLAWCNRKCGMAVRRCDKDTVICSCGSTFCFLCRSDAHYPATCRQLRLWEKERLNTNNFNGMALYWISMNTKECPKCFVPTQKIGGCNHMTCTGCRYEYCWFCFGNWNFHFDCCKQSDFPMEQFRINSRGTSDVFAHHFARYEHHKKCLKRGRQNTLDKCRRTLMNSYIFGYYMKDGTYTSSLEKYQQKLEVAVGNLAVLRFENDQKILAEECLTLRKALLDHCSEGAEHEDLEGRQPVKNVVIDTHDSFKFWGAVIFDLCLIVVAVLGWDQLTVLSPTMTTSFDRCTTPNLVLSSQNIFDEMKFDLSDLEPLLPITLEQRQLLLLKFNWDIETLKNSLQEYADTNSFLVENGVCPKNTVSFIKKSECDVCCSKLMVLGLKCRHMACFNCWSKYLTAKIRNKQCMLSCIEVGCGMLISNEMLGNFLSSSKLKITHQKLIKESYINSDSSLAWCNRKCGMAVRRSSKDTITCSCGSTFCFLCRSDAHYPATCRQLRLWEEQRSNSDGITLSWIILNTKECPRCFIPIQKNGGCNHMTCTGCRYQYCWVCSQNWRTHSGKCKQSDFTMEKFRPNLRGNSDVFAHHFARYEHHKKCLEKDRRVLSACKTQNTLDKSHQTLMNSYVFGYYLKEGTYTRSLEKYQQKLEITVEELARQQNGYNPGNVKTLQTERKVSKLAEECLTLRKALLAHCAKGTEHEDLEGRQRVESAATSSRRDCEQKIRLTQLPLRYMAMPKKTIQNQVLSNQNIFDEINSAVSELEPILPITPEKRQLLLLKFNWDIESLRNSFQECGDTNSFLLENGVCPENTVAIIRKASCDVCCSKVMVLGLRCQHMACLNCWSNYLTAKIKNKLYMISCIEYGCVMLITNEILGNFLSSPKLKFTHQKLIKYSYMNSDPSLAWCNIECGMAVRRSTNDTVVCSCGSTFCFLCRSDAHYPATCRQLRLWEKQLLNPDNSDGISLYWISLNTKECPKCFVPTQKDGGCSHMTCTGCRYQYCWICSQKWGTHPRFGGCNQSDTTMKQFKPNPRENSDVFAHCFARYEHHKKFLKGDRWVLSANKIQNTLVECRRVLMNSYVFGYYLKEGTYTSSLEKYQQKLEIAVWDLAVLRFASDSKMLAEKCSTFRKSLLDHCSKGAEHENLEGRKPVKKVIIDTHDSTEFWGPIVFGLCFIVVAVLGWGFLHFSQIQQ
ncbi:unnamed protein product [Caenorhabditis brenneri]